MKLLEHNSAVFLPPSFFDLKVYFETRRGALPLFRYFNSSHKMALPMIKVITSLARDVKQRWKYPQVMVFCQVHIFSGQRKVTALFWVAFIF